MKKLLFILLLFPLIANAQLPLNKNIFQYSDPNNPADKLFATDKASHLQWGITGTYMVTFILAEQKVKDPYFKGAMICMGIGFTKEYFYDKSPSANDLLADFTAVLIGTWLAKQSYNKWLNEDWHKKRDFDKRKKITVTNTIDY